MMKPDCTIPEHDGSKFTWNKGHGFCWVSDLSHAGMGAFSTRVWKDACDHGFYVVSPKTGVKKLFLYAHELKNNDEVGGWVFVEHGAAKEAISITVFND